MRVRRSIGILGVVSVLAMSWSPGPASAAAAGDVRWSTTANGPVDGMDEPTDIALSPDGTTVFVTGMSHSSPCGDLCLFTHDYMTVAYDTATGAELWNARYDGPVPDGLGRFDTDIARAVAVSPDGSTVVVTGFSAADVADEFPPVDMVTIAYDAQDGEQLWLVRRGEPLKREIAVDVAVSPDGTAAFVTGTTPDGNRDDITTVALALKDGSELWADTFDRRGDDDIPASIAVSPDGTTVAVVGRSDGASADAVTLLLDATDGSGIVRRYDGRLHGTDRATAVAFGADGTAYVTGSSANRTDTSTLTVAYAADGTQRWVHRENVTAGAEAGDDVEVRAGDTQVVVGGTARFLSDRRKDDDMVVMVLDTTDGSVGWIRRINVENRTDQLAGIALTPDGGTILAAGSHYDRRWSFLVTAYEATDGGRLWRSAPSLIGSGPERAIEAVADAGGLYLTGTHGGTYDVLTAAFEI